MAILEDTKLFVAIIQQGSFSAAAKKLGVSNGAVSRRISDLEANLGVTLIHRTTRQLQLTAEGQVFLKHAERIQDELNAALLFIQTSKDKPKGKIRISAPLFFGHNYLTPVVTAFLEENNGIDIDLILTNKFINPIKHELDIMIRGAGFVGAERLGDSQLKSKILIKEKIGLYASISYLKKHGEPKSPTELLQHRVIHFSDKNVKSFDWEFQEGKKKQSITLLSKFISNDIGSNLAACKAGHGIAKFTDLNVKQALENQEIYPILTNIDWGRYQLFTLFSGQPLPLRVRLFLDYLHSRAEQRFCF